MSDGTKHALLSPSSSHGWLACAGQPAMCADKPNDDNEYSSEGTAMHSLAALCLNEKKDAAAYQGRRFAVGHRTFDMDEDRCAVVQTYLDNVRIYAEGNELMVEQALPIGHITGEQGAEGTGDAVIITADGEELQLHDLKCGRGVTVSARNNPQLMLYALGALELVSVLGYSPKRFRLVIHQPRVNTAPDEWDCTFNDLMSFKVDVVKRASVAMTAYKFRANWIGKSEDYLTAGDHCAKSFCKARATCPALAKFVEEGVGADFETITNLTPETAVRALVGDPSDDKLSVRMKATDIIEDWIRAVRAEVERRLLAAVPVPGFKLVQGRQGARAWSDPEKAEEALKSMRLKQEEMYDFKLISPTTAEKRLKDTPKRWTRLQPLISRSEGKPSVAPESDKRPALVMQPAADDFAVVEEGADLV